MDAETRNYLRDLVDRRQRRNAGEPEGATALGQPRQHGTEYLYVRVGCRCEPCKRASADARARRRAENVDGITHHGRWGHSNGCRCDVCLAGVRTYRRSLKDAS